MKTIAGVDEVGRGSLIGPVYAAAVILIGMRTNVKDLDIDTMAEVMPEEIAE